MSQREGKPAFRGQKRHNGNNRGRDQRDQRDQRDHRNTRDLRDHQRNPREQRDQEEPEQGSEERKFVPWLGEARPKRGPIYDFDSKLGSRISMEFLNGRIVEGVLVSFDKYMNLVLDDTVEILDEGKTRHLGKVFTCGRVEALGAL